MIKGLTSPEILEQLEKEFPGVPKKYITKLIVMYNKELLSVCSQKGDVQIDRDVSIVHLRNRPGEKDATATQEYKHKSIKFKRK